MLIGTTVVRSVGRGVFITLTALYLTHPLGFSVKQAGAVVSVASLAGIAGSYVFGRLADKTAPRRIMAGLLLVESAAFAAYALVGSYPQVVVAAMAIGTTNLGGSAVRSVVWPRYAS